MKRSFFVGEPHVTMGPLLAQARYAVFMKVGVIFRPKESSQKRQFYNDTKLRIPIISMKSTVSLTYDKNRKRIENLVGISYSRKNRQNLGNK